MSGGVGRGVQVLEVTDDGKYRVCSEALRSVAARAELRGLPAAVVSVAGATRGGKSFLLDFFLRYLRATPAAQRDGTWIGADDVPLDGFSWRGGWQRNTTGILLWSEPIVVTQQIDGKTKKLVVLLMDTQGTFDNTSTVRDCTTIFAMSTLLSSVQIYNLAQQIKEDDLQHLQLFTEYGKLACSADDMHKPFQSLVFRIRDWMCPYEQPYGALGGENYLQTILKKDSGKKQELQELREHIRDSFDSVSCFLMPHPGFSVEDEHFSGRLCDLRPEFIDSLLGFVPSILDTSKLIPKVINGHEVTVGDLPTYFNSYADVFNSPELPTPQTILKATSTACLEAAESAARALYCERMERGNTTRSVPRAAMPRLHAAARDAARAAFLARRTLAAPERAAARLEHLIQELDDLLVTYIERNDGKTQACIQAARDAFEARLRHATGGRPLCLHARHVTTAHKAAVDAATAAFDAGREPTQERDVDRDTLLQNLESKLAELTATNNQNNLAASAKASAQYSASMQRAMRSGALSAARLRDQHERAKEDALVEFASARNQRSGNDAQDDHFLNDLLRNIEEQFVYLETTNASNNKSAKQAAISIYNNHMASVWSPGTVCLHPDRLHRENSSALSAALDEFRSASNDVDQENDIKQTLNRRYKELSSLNSDNNGMLVNDSYNLYAQRMDSKCTPSLTSILVVPWLVKILVMVPKYHNQYRKETIEYFHAKRRGSGDGDDVFLDQLKSKIAEGYAAYRHPLIALAREFGIPLPSDIL